MDKMEIFIRFFLDCIFYVIFIQCGLAPLHLLLLRSGLSADERPLLLLRLLAAGAALYQIVACDDLWVCICIFRNPLT